MKAHIPNSFKLIIMLFLDIFRLLTCWARVLPDFIIIGASRSGTTSLYNYLIEHPCVVSASKKEVHFFDINFKKGLLWYKKHFPLLLWKYLLKKIYKNNIVTGEASPYYIFHPHASKRVFKTVPKVKIIILLRNPVDRAYSQYQYGVKRGETLSFENAIKREKKNISKELNRMLRDENYLSFEHQDYSFLSRGIYVDQLNVWMDYFSNEKILILKSEDFFNNPQSILNKVCKFLNVPSWKYIELKKYSSGSYPKMEPNLRTKLVNYFRPNNKKLYDLLNRNFDWDK